MTSIQDVNIIHIREERTSSASDNSSISDPDLDDVFEMIS